MRVWDLPPSVLCRQHLLGEHRELHAIWSILTKDKKGYRGHPEVRRWEGHLWALYARHFAQVVEMTERGYKHKSSLVLEGPGFERDPWKVGAAPKIASETEQLEILRKKGCACEV